jgi:hypothetical protein
MLDSLILRVLNLREGAVFILGLGMGLGLGDVIISAVGWHRKKRQKVVKKW